MSDHAGKSLSAKRLDDVYSLFVFGQTNGPEQLFFLNFLVKSRRLTFESNTTFYIEQVEASTYHMTTLFQPFKEQQQVLVPYKIPFQGVMCYTNSSPFVLLYKRCINDYRQVATIVSHSIQLIWEASLSILKSQHTMADFGPWLNAEVL